MKGAAPRLAVVLWNGNLGGAETVSVAVAEALQRLGGQVTVVFTQGPWPLAKRLQASGIAYTCLGLRRGRDVLRHPRLYAAAVAAAGADGALLLECGYMGAMLRAGGYRGSIVAVEHGSLLGIERFTKAKRLLWRLDRRSGARTIDAEVAVSDFMLECLRQHPHAPRICRIHNGIDPHVYTPAAAPGCEEQRETVVGFAGRLIAGKGADRLIAAVAQAQERAPLKLLIAGGGAERERLERLARELKADAQVSFCGAVDDMPAFWRRCDIAAIPSDTFVESFSMTTLEAMASGRACVATRNGAIPELIVDGVTGVLVAPGDVGELARALVTYAEQPQTRARHGQAARARAVESFHVDRSAAAYLDLFEELAVSRRPARS